MGRRVKLTPDQVQAIRENFEHETNSYWAKQFDVSTVTVIAAKKGHRQGYAFIQGGSNG